MTRFALPAGIVLLVLSMLFHPVFPCLGQEVPQQISYQGKLLEGGLPVTGTRDFVFTIGTWTEAHAGVAIEDGLYSVQLGSITPIPYETFTESATATLEIRVDGTPLSPDVQILAVPYAVKAEEAHRADQLGDALYVDNANVGVGTASPQANLDMAGGSIRLGGETRYTWPAGPDNLGNHTATENVRMNGHWLSGDGGNEGLYVNNYGYVGVGATDLSYFKLDVNGMLRVRDNMVLSNNWLSGDGDDEGIFVSSSGNVGVGTYNTREKLEVNGTVRASNSFNVNGANGVSGQFNVVTQINSSLGVLWIYQRQITVTGGIITAIGPENYYTRTP